MAKQTTDKLLTLPKGSIRVLEFLANAEGRSVKNYMERVLIGHANDNEGFVKSKPVKK